MADKENTELETSPAPAEEAPTQVEGQALSPENKDHKELLSWKEDTDFVEFLKEKGIRDISLDNAEAVREFHKEYKERQQQDNKEDKPKEDGKEQQKSEMSVGSEEKPNENQEENTDNGENTNRDTNTLEGWKKWAKDHNYIFEDTNENDWEYSFNLYKNKEDMEAKNPSTTVKGKGDSLMVKSDDLEVYREIARQAKEKGYTSINLKDTLSPEQAQMMALAALEQGLNVKGNTQEIDLKNETFKDLSEESKKKAEEYNNRIAQEKPKEETNQQETQQENSGNADSLQTSIEKALAAAKEFKEKNPEGTMGYPKTDDPMIMATNIYAAHVAGCKIKDTGGFVNLPFEAIKNLPAEHRQGMLVALGAYNTEMGTKMSEQARGTLERLDKGEKVNGVEKVVLGRTGDTKNAVNVMGYKITEQDPTKRALLFATIIANKNTFNRPIFEPKVDNVAAGVPIQYLPENLRSVLSQENYAARIRQRDEILHRRENATGKDKEYVDAHKQLRDKEAPKESKDSSLDIVRKYQEEKRRGM